MNTTGLLPTSRLKTYKHRANAVKRARQRQLLYPEVTMALVVTPLGYAVIRADHVGRYDLSGGRVIELIAA